MEFYIQLACVLHSLSLLKWISVENKTGNVHVNICVMADKCELEVLIDNHENNNIVIAHYSSFVCVNSAIS